MKPIKKYLALASVSVCIVILMDLTKSTKPGAKKVAPIELPVQPHNKDSIHIPKITEPFINHDKSASKKRLDSSLLDRYQTKPNPMSFKTTEHFIKAQNQSQENRSRSSIHKQMKPSRMSFKRIPDLTTLRSRFVSWTKKSCNKTLCNTRRTHCNATTVKDWLNIIDDKALKTIPLYSENEFFYPWERQFLETPPLEDIKALPSLKLSKVYLIAVDGRMNVSKESSWPTGSGKTVVLLTKNVPAIFRVDLVDANGRPRGIGGDEIRAWLEGEADWSMRLKDVWATAEVKDLGNGSYDVTAMPTWSGRAKLKVTMSYPREYIRLALYHFRIGLHRFLYGKFQHKKVEEITVCHGHPNVPGRNCVCNLTSIISVPFYCGMPLDPRLTCESWTSVFVTLTPGYKDATGAESTMEKDISTRTISTLPLIQSSIEIKVKDEKINFSLPPCTKADRRKSWTVTAPRGYWTEKKTMWNSLVCQEPPMTKKWLLRCLNSSTVWMIGDSNIRRMGLQLSTDIGCDGDAINKYPWNSVCRNKKYNITVQFRAHDHPLYRGPVWFGLDKSGTVNDYISAIPSTGDHILVLHYFLHFTASHPNVLHQRIESLKNAVTSLLARNPRVLVGIRGPHTAVEWKDYLMFAGDVLGPFMRQIYVDAFKSLHDKVVFLDGWEQSICYENTNSHPSSKFGESIWRTLLAYKCN